MTRIDILYCIWTSSQAYEDIRKKKHREMYEHVMKQMKRHKSYDVMLKHNQHE